MEDAIVSDGMDIMPEVVTPTGNSGLPPKPDISMDLDDFAKEMAKIEAESKGIPAEVKPDVMPAQSSQVQEPAKPESSPAAAISKSVAIPEKFKAADGGIDAEKVAKSTVAAEGALRKYLALESEMKRKANEVRNLQAQPAVTPVTLAPNGQEGFEVSSDFAARLEQDLQNPQIGAGKVLASLFAAAQNLAYQRVQNETAGLREQVVQEGSRRELQMIAEIDPWILEPEGFNTLSQIRQERPWVNNHPEPWKAAYREYLADKVLAERRGSQVSTPTPRNITPRAPAPAVIAANSVRLPAEVPVVDLTDARAVDEYVSKLPIAQQEEFFKKLNPRLNFR